MSKMIAIIDEPSDCFDCPLCSNRSSIGFKCMLSKENMNSIDLRKRPEWCALKSVKLKKMKCTVDDNYDGGLKHGFVDGWNAYFDEVINK